jgi:hypothetical protein
VTSKYPGSGLANGSIINKLVIWDVVPVKELKGCLKYVNAATQAPKESTVMLTTI